MTSAYLIGCKPGKLADVSVGAIWQHQGLASYTFESEACSQHSSPSTEIIGRQRELDPP
jgi:hypothetical protein